MTRETGPTVQVGGSLNTPAYRWPLQAGVILCVLSPISLGLRRARMRGWGRLRGIVTLLRYLGPVFLLASGLVGLAFAMAVRQALAARRRDLEIAPEGFAIIDRRGRREVADSDVVAVGFRLLAGRASIWVETREGHEQVDLEWESAGDVENDLVAGLLGRLADRLHARAVKAIDSGGTISGDGWELSRLGLQVGDSFDILPFTEMAKTEYHDGRLKVWTRGQVEPAVEVAEGSRNDAILHAILGERIARGRSEARVSEPSAPGLGLLLFERRPSVADRVGLWLLTVLLAASFLVLAVVVVHLSAGPMVAVTAVGLLFVSPLPALMRQMAVFRFHERGVTSSGLFGTRELPFEDVARVRVRAASGQSQLKIAFEPIPGRGRKKVVFLTKLTDDSLESIRAYLPEKLSFG